MESAGLEGSSLESTESLCGATRDAVISTSCPRSKSLLPVRALLPVLGSKEVSPCYLYEVAKK